MVITINPVPLPPFGGQTYNNITPFTYRDGLTFIQVLEALRLYVRKTLVEHIDQSFSELEDYVNKAIESNTQWTTETVNALVELVNTAVEQVNGVAESAEAAKVAAEAARDQAEEYASTVVAVQDTAVSGLIGSVSSATRNTLNDIFAPLGLVTTVNDLDDKVDGVDAKFANYTDTANTPALIDETFNDVDSDFRESANAAYQSRTTGVVMAADYGVSTANPNNYNAFMAAIAALNNSGVIQVGAGTFTTDEIILPPGISITGAGKGITKLKHTGVGNACISIKGTIEANKAVVATSVGLRATTIEVVNASGIVAGDLICLHDNFSYTTTDANYKSGEMLRVKSVSGNVITVYGGVMGSWAALDGVYTVGNSSRVSKINPVRGATVSDMSFIGSPGLGTGAVRVDYADKVSLVNLDAEQFGGFGIGINASRDVNITNFTARDLTDDVPNGLAGYAIYLRSACHNVSILGGNISRVRHGFTTMGDIYGMPHNVTLTGVTYSETTAAAIDTHAAGDGIVITGNSVMSCFQGLTSRARRVVIQDNAFYNTFGSHVITLAEENLRDYIVKSNTILGAPEGSSGISCRAMVIGLSIIDNIISDTGADAMFINPGTTNLFIGRNTVRNVGRSGTASYHVRAGNVGGNTTPGVSGGWTIIDNAFMQGSGTAQRAIDISTAGVTGAVIAKNKITGTFLSNTITGIILAAGSTQIVDNSWLSQAARAVTGSKVATAGQPVPALVSALTVLQDMGLITNSTT